MERIGITACVALLIVGFLQGCEGANSTARDEVVATSVSGDAWALIRKAQDTRLKRLSKFSSSGQFTLRWFEDDSRRWEQLDARLWWQLPDRMAMRLSTLGSRLALAGWNGPEWWVFDETGDQPRLSIFDMIDRGSGENQLLSPPLLFCLAGLVPFPEAKPPDLRSSSSGTVRFTIQTVNILVADRRVSMGLAARFELDSSGPRSVELIAIDGSIVARSTLTRLRPVECRGQPQGAWPSLPFRIHMVMPSDTGRNSEAKLSLDRPYAGGDVPSRMFDLLELEKNLKPAVTNDERSSR